MPIDIIDTANNQIQILDDGTTIADIMYALSYVAKERARHRVNNKLRDRRPTGNPRGRPRKTVVDQPPKTDVEEVPK
jgi:hypothetical protein